MEKCLHNTVAHWQLYENIYEQMAMCREMGEQIRLSEGEKWCMCESMGNRVCRTWYSWNARTGARSVRTGNRWKANEIHSHIHPHTHTQRIQTKNFDWLYSAKQAFVFCCLCAATHFSFRSFLFRFLFHARHPASLSVRDNDQFVCVSIDGVSA